MNLIMHIGGRRKRKKSKLLTLIIVIKIVVKLGPKIQIILALAKMLKE